MNTHLRDDIDPPQDHETFMASDWRVRLYYHPSIPPHVHAVVAVVLGEMPMTPMYYTGKATITREGHLVCDFMDGDGLMKAATYVGPADGVQQDVVNLIKALQKDNLLSKEEGLEFISAYAGWIAKDERRTH